MAHPNAANTTFFGGIDLGVNAANHPIAEVKLRADEWKAMGAQGIFLERIDYGWGTSRERQNVAVDYIHSIGLPVAVSPFFPAEGFSDAVDATYNPNGLPTSLGEDDFYLYDSHLVMWGDYYDPNIWRGKTEELKGYQDQLGFKIWSQTTTTNEKGYDENAFFYSWYAALLEGHDATGWGEPYWSAWGPGGSQAPYRTRPDVDPGTVFLGDVENPSAGVYTRETDLGTITVDTNTQTGTFQIPQPEPEPLTLRPKDLLIYYGYPSSFNLTYTVPGAAAGLGQYDYVILGAGLEKTNHQDHANTVAILAHADMDSTKVFGYIDLGVKPPTSNYPMTEIQTRVDEWKATGADGIFFDDFGYDFDTDRIRQNAAVDYTKSQGLLVAVNAWLPEDAFGSDVDPVHNPGGIVTSLTDGDFYLFESHQVKNDQLEPGSVWRQKTDLLETYQQSIDFKILSATTTLADTTGYNEDAFHYAYHSAMLYGHEATAWGEASWSANHALAPYRSRPTTEAGEVFIGPVVHHADGVSSRETDTGTLVVDPTTHSAWYQIAPYSGPSADLRPKDLLIYYGWPVAINQHWNVDGAAADLGQYDYVVLGGGLEKTSHPDHGNTVSIIAHPAMANTFVFGGIDLGVTTYNYSIEEVKLRIEEWKATGAHGVFLDDFGYGYGVSRARQNEAVEHAHSLGLQVCANDGLPADVFGDEINSVYNPTGAPTSLGTSDFYLWESHQFLEDQYTWVPGWVDKANQLQTYQDEFGFKVLSNTTTATDDVNAYDENAFFYAWYSAMLLGHEATAWGEYMYSAAGNTSTLAPYRARPVVNPGTMFVTGIDSTVAGVFSRQTDLGTITVDTNIYSGSFTPGGLPKRALAQEQVVETFEFGLEGNYPNPFNPSTTIGYALSESSHTQLVVYNALGQQIRTLVNDIQESGKYQVVWDGHDAVGRQVSSGVYFYRLIAGENQATRRMLLVK